MTKLPHNSVDPEIVRPDFAVLSHHPELAYLDSTASSLKPRAVIDAVRGYYEEYGVNVHRGVYDLSQRATEAFEAARGKVRRFINARSEAEVIFTRGTTEGINVIAATYGDALKSGDVVVLTEMEHHANIVPWQRLREKRGIELRWIPVTEAGDLDLTGVDQLLRGAKILAVTHMSNVLGVVNDVPRLTQAAHRAGAVVVVDGAQSVPHLPVDVQALDCDFLVFSGHKMCGPTGIGILYGKHDLLEKMPPYQVGGDMIREVTKEQATWNDLPWKLEAGTPNIAGAIGLGAAVDYLSGIGMERIWAHDQYLSQIGLKLLSEMDGVNVLGSLTSSPRGAVFAFDLPGVHPHDVGSILNGEHVAVRSGHHCAMPLHRRFELTGTTRASGYLYTTEQDLVSLVQAIKKVQEVFK